MRTITCLLAILAAAPALAGTWTAKVVPGGQGGNLLSLAGPSETKAFGIGAIKDQQGNDQMVWVRSPDGDTWSIQQMQPPSPGEMLILTDLQCASATKCFAVGMGINQQTMGFYNRFAISTDGGDTWAWPSPLMYAESRLIILDEQNIWAVGGATNGLKSSNGGNKWTFVTPRIGDDLFTALQDGSFIDLQNGWLVNGSAETDDKTGKVTSIDPKGALLRTTDAGKTWTALFRDVSELPSRVKFVNDKVGFLIGRTMSGPYLRRTGDGGTTWTDVALPLIEGAAAESIDAYRVFNDRAALFVATRSVSQDASVYSIWRMKDGKTLTEEPTPSHDGFMLGLACPTQKLCWAGGKGMQILRFDGTDADVVPDDPSGGSEPGTEAGSGTETGAGTETGEGKDSGTGGGGDGAGPGGDGAGTGSGSGSGTGNGSGGCTAGAAAHLPFAALALLALVAFRRRAR